MFIGIGIPVLFILLFVTVIVIVVIFIVRGTMQYSKNNKFPVLAVDAVAVTKRTSTSSFANGADAAGAMTYHMSTEYYITFEFETGSRQEFTVSGNVYGMIAEGDKGRLTFQGMRFLEFERF